jgi:hypothetical protein
MANAVGIQLADAVVSVINASTLGVTAERWYVPVHDIQKDLTDVKVSVVPRALTAETLSRQSDDFTYLVDIAIQQRLPNDCTNNTQIKEFADPLMLLMEKILDLFRGKGLAAVPGAQCMALENPFVFSPDHLDEKRVFTSIGTLHYKKDRTR